MSSFLNLYKRMENLQESKISPYSKSHPAFSGITSKMRAGGLSSAPLDTIKFIRETLYYLDIIDDSELNYLKKAPGFSGKKKAMLETLQKKQDAINANSQAITDRIEETLDDFINGVGTNRGRGEKYAAQAVSRELSKEMRKTKTGKQLDDALADTVSDEKLLIVASIAKVLGEIEAELGEEGFDIDSDALDEVKGFVGRISTLEQLKSFIKQLGSEPGYETIAAYLSTIVRPVERGIEDEEMQDMEVEDEEGMSAIDDEIPIMKPEDAEEDVSGEGGTVDTGNVTLDDHFSDSYPGKEKGYLDSLKAALGDGGEDEEHITEAYTGVYMKNLPKIGRSKVINEGVTFKERYKPKTSFQLEELRRYGL